MYCVLGTLLTQLIDEEIGTKSSWTPQGPMVLAEEGFDLTPLPTVLTNKWTMPEALIKPQGLPKFSATRYELPSAWKDLSCASWFSLCCVLLFWRKYSWVWQHVPVISILWKKAEESQVQDQPKIWKTLPQKKKGKINNIYLLFQHIPFLPPP